LCPEIGLDEDTLENITLEDEDEDKDEDKDEKAP
jgi:hypothetical protein